MKILGVKHAVKNVGTAGTVVIGSTNRRKVTSAAVIFSSIPFVQRLQHVCCEQIEVKLGGVVHTNKYQVTACQCDTLRIGNQTLTYLGLSLQTLHRHSNRDQLSLSLSLVKGGCVASSELVS